MKAYLFPGQGAQYEGMGQDLYDQSNEAKDLFKKANQILGYNITDIMFQGSKEDLKQTKVTQPAIFLHSVISAQLLGEDFKPDMVAGHSLGEFSALVAARAMSFDDGLTLVYQRAMAMQEACEIKPSTMAAVLALDNETVEQVCQDTPGVVVAANYNCPGQLVISGEIDAINQACETLKAKGAKRAIVLPVGGAFHSPLMEPAREKLAKAIMATDLHNPVCPIYQNAVAQAVTDKAIIKENLIAQLTAPVKWSQSVQQMIADGAKEFYELGPGKVLTGLMRSIDRSVKAEKINL
ncbi:MAG: [acyl-carrier-protein] S-malonyltransferase [Flavobacteriia bacterium]|nr:MAG: [acyl-carrier-protein] S-malonyltransferase [Flavobacteriia bacterium]